MNQALWQAHLEARVAELQRENERLRLEVRHQRARAGRWRARAEHLAHGPSYLIARMHGPDTGWKPKRQNAGVRAVSGREPAHQPPSQRGGL